MNIQEIKENFKQIRSKPDGLIVGIVVVVAFASFFLGKASKNPEIVRITTESNPAAVVQVAEPFIQNDPPETPQSEPIEGGYVGSKNGTKYHLPWCSGALRIKEENKVWFGTKEEAESSGYTPAANCKGL